MEEVWSKHLQDEDGLKQYARTMQSLATGQWAEQGSGRITWCVGACEEYFVGGVLSNQLYKDLRRLEHNMCTLVPPALLPNSDADVPKMIEEFQRKKWTLLDVGSCYNPFSEFDQFDVTAIDIAPANPTVLSCDFLNVSISGAQEEGGVRGSGLNHIKAGSFDIIIFSLLLSYLPSTELRLKCCINAHKVLTLHGILLIITPDSSHQNRHAGMMKSWKECIESIGFHRWRYVKDTHLHCMAFRKTRVDVNYDRCKADHPLLSIPQDSHEQETSSLDEKASDQCDSTSTCDTQLSELPFSYDEDCDD